MLTYVKQPAFWIAVVLVAVVANFVWMKVTGKGKLV
jgi:hypothetical protein